MKKIDVGQTLQVLGNAGVVVGILLLVYELNQNRDMMRAQTRNAIAQSLIDLEIASAADPEMLETQLKATSGAELAPVERLRYVHMMTATFRYWENVQYQYRQGLFDESEYRAARAGWRALLNQDRSQRNIWCSLRGIYSEQFAVEIDALLNEPCG